MEEEGDKETCKEYLTINHKIRDQIAGVKIGTELYAVCGSEGLKKFKELVVEIFLDLKNCMNAFTLSFWKHNSTVLLLHLQNFFLCRNK